MGIEWVWDRGSIDVVGVHVGDLCSVGLLILWVLSAAFGVVWCSCCCDCGFTCFCGCL